MSKLKATSLDISRTQAEIDSIVSPPEGMTVYNTTIDELQFYNGSGWKAVITTITGSGGGSNSDNSPELNSFLYTEVYNG